MTRRRKRIIIFTIFALGIIAGAAFAYQKYLDKEAKKSAITKTTKPTPTPTPLVKPSELDGTLVEPSLATRHPLAIMIENHTEARPQIGLNEASIVYEALAEGGITRFLAVYGPRIPETAGPVRSARTYYVDWAHEYDAFYTHFGGSSDALAKIPAEGIKDIDGMKTGQPYFWRQWYPGVTGSEHTAFTAPAKLYDLAFNTKKWPATSEFTKWTFKDDTPVSKRPLSGTLDINPSYGGTTFATHYDYDHATNTYKRSMAGAPHKDRLTGIQISPKNIIIQTANEIAKPGKKDHDVQTVGNGVAKIFFDGKMITGTWKKTSNTARTMFYDETGKTVVFNRGQSWIVVVPPGREPTWVPGPLPTSTPTSTTTPKK